MKGFAQLTAIGNLTRDPEIGYTPSGAAYCKFAIAVNSSWKDSSGELKERVDFLEMEAWSGLAETLAKHFRKGDPIFLTAVPRLEQWEDRQSGQKKSRVGFRVDEFRFIGSRDRDGGQVDGDRPQPRRAPDQSRRPTQAADGPPVDGDDDVPF